METYSPCKFITWRVRFHVIPYSKLNCYICSHSSEILGLYKHMDSPKLHRASSTTKISTTFDMKLNWRFIINRSKYLYHLFQWNIYFSNSKNFVYFDHRPLWCPSSSWKDSEMDTTGRTFSQKHWFFCLLLYCHA